LRKFGLVLALLIASCAFAASISAAPGLKLDKQDIGPKSCNGAGAKVVVDVHFTLVTPDSGFGGNDWANDTIDRHLRIWQQSDTTFCAQVEDHGKFVTMAGTSPGGSSTVGDGVTGNLEGGYVVSNIVGTLKATPDYATRGNLGGPYGDVRPSVASYVNSAPLNLSEWGWIYHAGKNGTWLNQDDVAAADSGDITG
jgi:hypothetical protein